jgi:hypothetical protein
MRLFVPASSSDLENKKQIVQRESGRERERDREEDLTSVVRIDRRRGKPTRSRQEERVWRLEWYWIELSCSELERGILIRPR